MNGLTDWLVREHVAQLRAQAARRYWRVEVRRARAQIGSAPQATDGRGASAVVARLADHPAYGHRRAAGVARSTSA